MTVDAPKISLVTQPTGPNRRTEPRHAIRATAILERKTGRKIVGSTVNISGSGVLLDLSNAGDLALGEEVGCSIQLYGDKPPQAWGVGRIVRLDRSRVAIEFTGLEWP
ncbi:MAG TPA: PilZ domain-containing protein [Bryobacteraceae bacterium]|nr:PilZ domain-containing protein [Bryobacteraceae bacterium]